MSKLQQAEKLASVTGLPKGDLMKILKQPQKAEPEVQAKRARYEPYPRQPFPSTGPGRWPAAGSGNGYYDRSSFE